MTVVITVSVVCLLLFGSIVASGLIIFAFLKNKSKLPKTIQENNGVSDIDNDRICQANAAYGVVQPPSPPVEQVYEDMDDFI